MIALTLPKSLFFPPVSTAPKSLPLCCSFLIVPTFSSEPIQLTPAVAVAIADLGEGGEVPGKGRCCLSLPVSLVSLSPHPSPPLPPSHLAQADKEQFGCTGIIFFPGGGRGVRIEERKARARMIGMRPRLLLSSSPWYSFWPLQGNAPVWGEQPVGQALLCSSHCCFCALELRAGLRDSVEP